MMETGYVHPVADGEITTLRDFALRCSWGMMALITKRDDDHSGEPPRELPEEDLSYYEGRLREAQAELDKLATMNEAERVSHIDKLYSDAMAQAKKYDAEADVKEVRVRAMREQVMTYTDGPDGLQRMMLETIDRSLEGLGGYRSADYVKRANFEELWDRAIKNVGSAYADIAKQKALRESRNVWLKKLWESVDALDAQAKEQL